MSSLIAGRRQLSRGTFPFLKTYASPAVALSLRLLPRLAKLVAYILIILNVRSLPFAWHSMPPPPYPFLITQMLILFLFMFTVHLYWPVVKIRWRAWCARIRTLSLSSAVREAAARKFLDDLCPVGQNPLDFTIVTKAWAGVYLVFSSIAFFAHSSGETLCVVVVRLPFGIRFLSQASMIATTIYILVIHLIPR
jgi:hypothetical protein